MGVNIDVFRPLDRRFYHSETAKTHNCSLLALWVILVFEYGFIRNGCIIRLQPNSSFYEVTQIGFIRFTEYIYGAIAFPSRQYSVREGLQVSCVPTFAAANAIYEYSFTHCSAFGHIPTISFRTEGRFCKSSADPAESSRAAKESSRG